MSKHIYKYEPRFGYPICAWFKWFAWYPVETIDRGVVWLRFVWKRRIQLHDYIYHPYPDTQWWQYAMKINQLVEK